MPRVRTTSQSERDDDKEALLSALNAHGQSFLQSFGSLPSVSGVKRKRAPSPPPEDEEEWQGIAYSSGSGSEGGSDDESDRSEAERKSASPPRAGPRVVVFSQNGTAERASSSVNRKAFMSSKVSKMRAEATQSRTAEDAEDEEEEKSNTRNDILLHELVQNSLLSGALDAGDKKTPSQKRKALEGRAMELAGTVKRGRGQRILKTTERGHAPRRIREGMEAKEADLNAKRLEEAKNVGNYHPTIKKLFGGDERAPQRKRERGLSLGVGKFVGGTLKLTPRDLAKVRGASGGGGRGGRGGGGSRGKGKSRG
ncbi:hypothetical protein AURDEDRAFT_110563 [Auricularia subglabra TFB-10046 SS5]|nr:hypothetical protein AURDEDRAFT_110563 [Auricularia subglabra TFB-10046 SS5]